MTFQTKTYDVLRECQPYFIYKRIQLTSPEGYFLHPIDYGFWYLLRRIHIIAPDIDLAGANFYPKLSVYAIEKAANRIPQNVPIPFSLFCTPSQIGCSIDAGNNLSAKSVKNVKLLNNVFPYRDNIELYISGQNPIGSPPFVDIMLIGYLIPEQKLVMWKE